MPSCAQQRNPQVGPVALHSLADPTRDNHGNAGVAAQYLVALPQ
jgi:hypothetical protein